jgi:hypothetical protein
LAPSAFWLPTHGDARARDTVSDSPLSGVVATAFGYHAMHAAVAFARRPTDPIFAEIQLV